MKTHLHQIIIVLTALSLLAPIQAQFAVSSLEGAAKIQRSGKRIWEDLSEGSKINDNDIVETFFKAKLTIKIGRNNVVLLGSNSKALFNAAAGAKKGFADVNFTLFAGGLFVKVMQGIHLSIYTANGVCETDSGAVSAIVEARSGETGFQVLGGTITARNISQQNGKVMTAGQTTMIQPGREPTAALYLTSKHVAVLNHFFGEEYIMKELKHSNIMPTDNAQSSSKILMSQNLASQSKRNIAQENMYKRPFSLEKIYGAIFDDQQQHRKVFRPILDTRPVFTNVFDLGLKGNFANWNKKTYSSLSINPQFEWQFIHIGLRFPYAANYQNKQDFYSLAGNTAGLLDIVDRFTIGYMQDSLYLDAGSIEHYTLGTGMVVNNYSNRNPYSLFRPMGARIHASYKGIFSLQAFMGDCMNYSPGGVYLLLQPSLMSLGFGYYVDLKPNKQLSTLTENRFIAYPDSQPPAKPDALHLYEVGVGIDAYSSSEFAIKVTADFCQNVLPELSGFAMRLPVVSVDWGNFNFGGGLNIEAGQTVTGLFSWNYPSNGYRIFQNTDSTVQFATATSLIGKKRTSQGLVMFLNATPVKGSSIELWYRQDIGTNKASSVDSTNNFRTYEYNVRLAVNDSLLSFLHYGEVFVGQTQGGLFPANGTWFPSWGFHAGGHIITSPFLFNLALEAGFETYFLDLFNKSGPGIPDNIVDNKDAVTEVYVGLRWGFL